MPSRFKEFFWPTSVKPVRRKFTPLRFAINVIIFGVVIYFNYPNIFKPDYTGNINWVRIYHDPTLVTFGLLFIFGIVMVVRTHLRTKEIKHLKKYGQKLQGALVDVQAGSTVNTKFIVKAKDLSGQIRKFSSDILRDDGKGLVAELQGHGKRKIIDVYVDPGNGGKYYVDIDSLRAE